MNYTEKYELRKTYSSGIVTAIASYSNEGDAIYDMGLDSRDDPGIWSVVRVMEVTVASVVKA